MFRVKRNIYDASPAWLKYGVQLVPFSLLAGESYRRTYGRARWMDEADVQDLMRYQEVALGRILAFAVDQIPAYRHLRSVVAKHKPFDALHAFPLIDKGHLQDNLHEYLPRNFSEVRAYRTTTGGTSGNQLTVFWDDASQAREMAFIHRHMNRAGYTLRHRKATFRGVPFSQLPPKVFWYNNPIHNELRFSPFHLNRNNFSAYVDRLVQYAPRYLHGYPSAISALAAYIEEGQVPFRLPKIRAVFLTSEGCSYSQRVRIERVFGTRVFAWYGHTERLIFGGECELTSAYHQFPDYGVLEIIDEEGKPCDQVGERGELVGTGLSNFRMPLIRYRTGDYATRLNRRCRCGRCWDRFTDVEGRRKQDVVIGRGGGKISVAALNMHGSIFDNVVRYQYFQDTPGVCVLKLMVSSRFSDRELTAIENAYQAKVGIELQFKAKVVSDIPLTGRGKLKLVDSRLAQEAA